MNTLIFAASPQEAQEYATRNCMFGARIITSPEDLIQNGVSQVILVGTFRKNAAWPQVSRELTALTNANLVDVVVEEWETTR